MNAVHRNNRIAYHKIQTILAVLRHQIDKDYGWEPQPLQYDLDVFFLDIKGKTATESTLRDSKSPPHWQACHFPQFYYLVHSRTRVCITTPDNLYAEHDHPYRLTYIVEKFSQSLMCFKDKTHSGKDYPKYEYLLNETIYAFACFLASLTGSTNRQLIAQFAMQLSLFKRYNAHTSPFALPPVIDATLVWKQVYAWLLFRGEAPVEDLLYHIVWQDKEDQAVAINTTDDLVNKLREDETKVSVKTVTTVNWDSTNEQGIRLSEIMMFSFDTSEDTPEFSRLYPLIKLVADGLNQGAPYDLFDYYDIIHAHCMSANILRPARSS